MPSGRQQRDYGSLRAGNELTISYPLHRSAEIDVVTCPRVPEHQISSQKGATRDPNIALRALGLQAEKNFCEGRRIAHPKKVL